MSMDTPDKKEPAETKTVEVSAIQFEENRRMLEETLRVPMDQRADVVEEVNQMEHKATVRYRMGRDELTAALREALVSMADKHARKEYGDAVAEVSAKWSNETTIEGLAEWLENGGWNDVYGDAGIDEVLVESWGPKTKELRLYYMRNLPEVESAFFRLETRLREIKAKTKQLREELKAAEKTNDLDRLKQDLAEAEAEQERLEKTPTPPVPEPVWEAAEMTAKRGDALPDPASIKPPMNFPRPAYVVPAIDGLRVYIRDFQWSSISRGLAANNWKLLRRISGHWLRAKSKELAEGLERQKAAADLDAAPRVKVKGRDFRRLPKAAAGVSWAFGGPGVELSRVTVDGREYAPAPDLAVRNPSAIVPASYALLPEDHTRKPHQTLLPIDLQGGEDAPPLPVALAGATQYAIAPAAGKLGLLVMAAAHTGGGKLHKTTLRELTRTINPEAAKLVTSHYETVMRGLVQLDGLRLVLPNGLSYRVYECPVPWRELRPEEYDAPLFVGMTRTFEKTLAAIGEIAGASYRGDFLFDLTGAMLLPTRRPGLLRQYIRSCAFWNAYWTPGTAGEPDPARVPEVSAERWAAMTNRYSPAAVEYLRANGKGDRFKLSHSIKETLADAEALAEAGLVKIAKASRKAVRLLPPPEYLEAWAESRKGAHKIPGNTGKA